MIEPSKKPRVAVAKSKNRLIPPAANAVIFYVYGIVGTEKINGIEEDQVIKIGYAESVKNQKNRAYSHGRTGPGERKVKFLASVWAMEADESFFKSHFKKHMLNAINGGRKTVRQRGMGEWFRVNDDIHRWLYELRKKSYVATECEEDIDNLKMIADPRDWLPNKEAPEFYGFIDPTRRGHVADWSEFNFDSPAEGDYYTPSYIPRIVGEDLYEDDEVGIGGIGRDPASCKLANDGDGHHRGIGARAWFGQREDALKRKWTSDNGRIWLNPPYKQWDEWLGKLFEEIDAGRVKEACVLGPCNATTNKNFQVLMERCNAMWIPQGRIKFWGPKAREPDQGSYLFYIGPHRKKFQKLFSKLKGTVWIRPKVVV